MLYTNQSKVMGLIAGANFIIFFFLTLFLRISYIAISRGLIVEIFKVIGTLIGSIFAFQYYPLFAERITKFLPFLNRMYLEFLSFLIIFCASLIFISLIRKVITAFFEKKGIALREKIISLFIGWFRFAFLSSIIIFLLNFSPFNPEHFEKSKLSQLLKPVAPKIYLASFNLHRKFNSKLILNEEVERYYETKRPLSESNKKGN